MIRRSLWMTANVAVAGATLLFTLTACVPPAAESVAGGEEARDVAGEFVPAPAPREVRDTSVAPLPPDPPALRFLLPYVRATLPRPRARREKLQECIDAAGEDAPAMLLAAWVRDLARYEAYKALAKMRAPKAVDCQRRLLIAAAAIGDTTPREVAYALAEAGDGVGVHFLLYYLGQCWWDERAAAAIERASGGAIDIVPPPPRDERRDGTRRRWRWPAHPAHRASLERAERWWAGERERMLAPVAGEIAKLKIAAATVDPANPWPRREAIGALIILGAENEEAWLRSFLEEDDGVLHERAVRALLGRGLTGFVDEAARSLEEADDPAVRFRAAGVLHAALVRMGSENPLTDGVSAIVRDALVAALDDADPMVARAAALAVLPKNIVTSREHNRSSGFNMKLVGVQPWILTGMRAVLEDVRDYRDTALRRYAESGGEWQFKFLKTRLRALRHEVMRSPHEGAALVKAGNIMIDLGQAGPGEMLAFGRRAVASSLREHMWGCHIPELIRLRNRDGYGGAAYSHDWIVFEPEDLPALFQQLERPGARVDMAVGLAIGRIADERHVPRLRRLLDSHELYPKRVAAAGLALAMLGDAEATGALREIMATEWIDTRWALDKVLPWAGVALAGLGDWQSLDGIRGALERSAARIAAFRKRMGLDGDAPAAASGNSKKPSRFRGLAVVGSRYPPGWQPDPAGPPRAQLPKVEPGMKDDECRAALDRWWLERRVWRER